MEVGDWESSGDSNESASNRAAYRGVRSIFVGLFESEDFALRLRWTAAEQRGGYPYAITGESIDALGVFAEAEVSAMITSGTKSTTTGLPTFNKQALEASAGKYGGKGWRIQEESAGKRVTDSSTMRANSVKGNGRKSDTMSPWASTACKHWTKGYCRSGILCPHRHDGFEIHDGDGLVNRCFVCGKTGHHSNECPAPGGGKDPEKAKHWNDYNKIKREHGT